MKIYVASSWRNMLQPLVVERLKSEGFDVYDFRNPCDGNHGFHWSDIDKSWMSWDCKTYRDSLSHPIAEECFGLDMDALRSCDACVYVLPCGRSASLEVGWAAGNGKLTIALISDAEPELMIKMLDHVCLNLNEVVSVLRTSENIK